MTKICRDCGEKKSITDFPLLRGCVPYTYCRACKAKQDKSSYIRNRTKRLQVCAEYRKYNRQAVMAKTAEWRKLNPERVKLLRRSWRKKNPEAKRVSEATRRARKRKAGGRHTVSDIKALMAQQHGQCAICRLFLETYHVDHVMPLALGGDNSKENIQLLCPTCNDKKGAMHPQDFLRKLGLLA
jgi:5-methylcytosine-specific restriction endonuclease McrA